MVEETKLDCTRGRREGKLARTASGRTEKKSGIYLHKTSFQKKY
jgi:hypothetical protein